MAMKLLCVFISYDNAKDKPTVTVSSNIGELCRASNGRIFAKGTVVSDGDHLQGLIQQLVDVGETVEFN